MNNKNYFKVEPNNIIGPILKDEAPKGYYWRELPRTILVVRSPEGEYLAQETPCRYSAIYWNKGEEKEAKEYLRFKSHPMET